MLMNLYMKYMTDKNKDISLGDQFANGFPRGYPYFISEAHYVLKD